MTVESSQGLVKVYTSIYVYVCTVLMYILYRLIKVVEIAVKPKSAIILHKANEVGQGKYIKKIF